MRWLAEGAEFPSLKKTDLQVVRSPSVTTITDEMTKEQSLSNFAKWV